MLNKHFGLQDENLIKLLWKGSLAFCAIQENQAVGIDQQINSRHAQLIAENKMKLK